MSKQGSILRKRPRAWASWTVSLAISVLNAAPAHATGWYRVSGYEGHIGPYPVHLVIQRYEARSGDYELKGTYYYDTKRGAIPIYGSQVSGSRLSLCELQASEIERLVDGNGLGVSFPQGVDTSTCAFQLTRHGDDLAGTWYAAGRTLDVSLRRTGSFDDTARMAVGRIDVPYWGQTRRHLFIGSYDGDAEVTIKVVDKRSGSLVQTIHPGAQGCEFGAFMTPIADNVEPASHGHANAVIVTCRVDRGDQSLRYILNPRSGTYLPLKEGSNRR